MKRIVEILKKCGAGDAACIKFSDCDIINERLVERLQFTPRSVFIATVPYYSEYCDQPKTVSSYALSHDYHILLKHIAETAIGEAKTIFPNATFKFFGDHSPINEKLAAAKAGLGIIGSHSLLITKQHSSFVFLFELISDLDCEIVSHNIEYCKKCNKCISACPGFLQGKCDCLSAITQKKGALTEEETAMIAQYGYAWGCDICQNVCPYTQEAIKNGTIYTNADWFNNNICSSPNVDSVSDSNDFEKRAYSWRGKDTILRNINIINGENK